MAVYNPHENLTVNAVCKLDMVTNTPLLVKLEPKLNELSQRGRFIPLDEEVLHVIDDYRGIKYENEFSKVVTYIHSWVRCRRMSYDVVLPSWKNFFTILREISPELSIIVDQIQADFDRYLTRQPESETKGML